MGLRIFLPVVHEIEGVVAVVKRHTNNLQEHPQPHPEIKR